MINKQKNKEKLPKKQKQRTNKTFKKKDIALYVMYQEFLQVKGGKTNNFLRKWAKYINSTYKKKYLKNYQTYEKLPSSTWAGAGTKLGS